MKSINCRGKLFEFNHPKVMGILNFTPDSFSDGGKYSTLSTAVSQVEKMLEEEADIIDIGAISSKPGALSLDSKTEKERLKPLLKELSFKFPNTIFSLDTFRSEIAEWAVKEFNISIINDISAGELDSKMFTTISKLQVPFIMMHMQGTPVNMQNAPKYANVTQDVIKYFSKKLFELKQLGVHDIIIDPGFGFGKTMEHNFQLIKGLEFFKIFDQALLVGVSRKSMIQKSLNVNVDKALNGTTILNTIAISKGANIIRVHDVKEAKQIIKIYSHIEI